MDILLYTELNSAQWMNKWMKGVRQESWLLQWKFLLRKRTNLLLECISFTSGDDDANKFLHSSDLLACNATCWHKHQTVTKSSEHPFQFNTKFTQLFLLSFRVKSLPIVSLTWTDVDVFTVPSWPTAIVRKTEIFWTRITQEINVNAFRVWRKDFGLSWTVRTVKILTRK
jgi:hypothetical protein